MKFKSISDVVDYQSCSGCGGCSYLYPNKIRMVDVEDKGIRPEIIESLSDSENKHILDICSSSKVEHLVDKKSFTHSGVFDLWGPVLAVYEGYSSDPNLRYAGSSGGVISAISHYALSSRIVDGILHTVGDESDQLRNKTVYTTSVSDVIKASGSRYAPSSPLSELSSVMSNNNSLVIGKPCDIATLYNLENTDGEIRKKISARISFFCAGVPSTLGNKSYFKKLTKSKPENLISLKYRGNGWPGLYTAKISRSDDLVDSYHATYAESWGSLQSYRQWKCYICPDHSGEFSDISVGDPWYREIGADEKGSSLIIVRTLRGAELLRNAIDQGYIVCNEISPDLISKAQPNLIVARGSLWGRLLILRLFNIPVQKSYGFNFFKFWLGLSFRNKFSSIFGTAKRIFKKKLFKRDRIH